MTTQTATEQKVYHAVSMRDADGDGRIYYSQEPETVDQAMERAALFAYWYNFDPVKFEIRKTYGE